MKRFIWLALLLGLTSQPLAAWAKDATAPLPAVNDTATKPVAVLAVEGYDALLSDIGYIGQLSSNPELAQQLDGMLKLFTQGQGVKGLDTTRPWGVVLSSDGIQFQPLAFLPVVNLKQLLTSLGPLIGEAKPNGDSLEVRKNNRSLFLKEVAGWAFIVQSPDGLATLPKDPAGLLGSLTKNYDVALQINVQNIPEVFRELAIGQLKATVQNGMKKESNESDEAYAARQKMVNAHIEDFADGINDTNQVTIGWKLDSTNASTFLDLQVTAVPGSKMSKQLSQSTQIATAFSGFLIPTAAVSVNGSAKVSPETQERVTGQLEVGRLSAVKKIEDSTRDEGDRQLAVAAVNDLVDILKKTVASGKMDFGAEVSLDEVVSAAGGFYVSDPLAVEKLIKKVAAHPKAPPVKFDVDKSGGVRFHALSIPLPDPKAAKALGSNLEITVGIGAQNVYVAIGSQGASMLKGVIDKTADRMFPPFQLNAGLAPILTFADKQSDDPKAESLAAEAQKSVGKDHIRLVANPEKNGVTYHLELEEGVLKVLGKASKAQANAR